MTVTHNLSLRASSEAIHHNNQSLRASAKQSITYSTQPFICQRLLRDFVSRNDFYMRTVIASVYTKVIASISEAIHHNNQSLRASAKQSVTYSTQPFICQRLLRNFVSRNDFYIRAVIASVKRSNPSLFINSKFIIQHSKFIH